MANYFKPYYLGCLAHASNVIGGSDGSAAVIDPRRDVDEYITDAAAAGLVIRYVIETHLQCRFCVWPSGIGAADDRILGGNCSGHGVS